MANRGKKRGHSGEHENHERWLLTYADMITLLVAFFIMLYAMSVMNITKFEQLAVSVRSGFGGSVTNGTPTIMQSGGGVNGIPSIVTNSDTKNHNEQANSSPGDIQIPSKRTAATQEDRRFQDLKLYLQKFIINKGLRQKVQIVINERGMTIRLLTDDMLFESGKSELRGEELSVLDEVSSLIRNRFDNQIAVEGHTDSLPIHTSKFPSNWELSTARATTVLRYLGDHGVPWERLRAAGYADQRPVALNNSQDGRRRNRRVDIVILRKYSQTPVDGVIS